MSNIFTCNPIQLNIFSYYKKRVTDTFVLLSDLEETIDVELKKIMGLKKYNSKKLFIT